MTEEMHRKQLPMAISQWQICDLNIVIVIILDVGASANRLAHINLHRNEGREVAAGVTKSQWSLPAEIDIPQERQVHTCNRNNGDIMLKIFQIEGISRLSRIRDHTELLFCPNNIEIFFRRVLLKKKKKTVHV